MSTFEEAPALRSHPHPRLAGLAGLLSVALLAACGGGSEGSDDSEITLTYAFFAPEQSFPAVQMQEWADRLAEETDGQVNVELFPGGTLLDSGDIYDGVRQGVADVGLDVPAYDVGRFPVSSVVTLPIGFENARVASLTLLDLLDEYDPPEFAGYEIITAFTTEPARLQTVDPVTSREDLDGLELRSTGAQVPALQRLGASPVGMPMPEVSEALQTGVISGYSSSREVLQDFQLAEQVSYVTDYNFGLSGTFVAVMDSDAFAELPEDVQDVIRELRPEMTVFASEYHDLENVEPALEWATEEHGVEVVELEEDEAAAWDEAVEGVIDEWVEEAADSDEAAEILERTIELRDEYSAAVS